MRRFTREHRLLPIPSMNLTRNIWNCPHPNSKDILQGTVQPQQATSFFASFSHLTSHIENRMPRVFWKLLMFYLVCSFSDGVAAKIAGGHADYTSCTFREKSNFIKRAHSHNDYSQARPFHSAIQHGMKSIEVDVFPRRGCLLVAHTVLDLDPTKHIDTMYIKPILSFLKRRRRSSQSSLRNSGPLAPLSSMDIRGGTRASAFRRQGGPVSQRILDPTMNDLTLLVDFKGNPDVSTELLEKALKPLRPFLSRVTKKGVFRRGQVTVVISGNKPNPESLLKEHSSRYSGERFLFLDGREKDLRCNSDTTLVPMVSVPWRVIRLAKSRGRGELYMRSMARKAREQGKLLRIWGAPNEEKVWSEMVRSNIDLLSIDDHSRFARFAGKQDGI